MPTIPPSTVNAPEQRANLPEAELKPSRYGSYRADLTADIKACVQAMSWQQNLFIGLGLSRRYFGAPSWDELSAHLASKCPFIEGAGVSGGVRRHGRSLCKL